MGDRRRQGWVANSMLSPEAKKRKITKNTGRNGEDREEGRRLFNNKTVSG